MADITITCAACGKVNAFSEFVSSEAFKCRGCGGPLSRPAGVDGGERAKTKFSPMGIDLDTQARAEADSQEARDPRPEQKNVSGRHTKAVVRHHWYAWALFFFLGAIAAYLRYGGGLSKVHLGLLAEYAIFGAFALHILIILKAFEDSVFQGILCLLIPLYTVYYIFSVSDAIYLRAVAGAVLIGIGQDAAVVLQDRFLQAVTFVHRWIESGG
jgi:hypothetical protein